jgi:hypothetical protein
MPLPAAVARAGDGSNAAEPAPERVVRAMQAWRLELPHAEGPSDPGDLRKRTRRRALASRTAETLAERTTPSPRPVREAKKLDQSTVRGGTVPRAPRQRQLEQEQSPSSWTSARARSRSIAAT